MASDNMLRLDRGQVVGVAAVTGPLEQGRHREEAVSGDRNWRQRAVKPLLMESYPSR